jgi:ADP-heptose:LPS heptosyltransferase
VVAIQIERIGDLLVSTPALRNLRRSVPGAQVTLVCRPETAGVLRGWDAIDEITVFDTRWPVDRQRRFIRNLRAQGHDLTVTLTSSRPAYRLARRLGGRRRGGLVYGANLVEAAFARLVFTHPVRIWIGEQPAEDARVPHRVEELLAINAALGLDALRLPLEVPLTQADEDRATALLARARVAPRRAVVLHVGRGDRDSRAHGKWMGDGWGAPDLVALARGLQALTPTLPLVLTAGREDAEAVAALESTGCVEPRHAWSDGIPGGLTMSVSTDGALVLLRDCDFPTWAAVLGQSAVIVTPNTAAVHLASAVGRPVVAVYPAERYAVNSREWAPWMVPCRVLMKDQPTTTIGCVVDAAADLLAARRAGGAGEVAATGTPALR